MTFLSLKLTAAALLQTQEGLSGQHQEKGKTEEEVTSYVTAAGWFVWPDTTG